MTYKLLEMLLKFMLHRFGTGVTQEFIRDACGTVGMKVPSFNGKVWGCV